MIIRELLNKVFDDLTEEHQRELLDFAQFLSGKQEAQEWSQGGLALMAGALESLDEGYTPAEIKPETAQ